MTNKIKNNLTPQKHSSLVKLADLIEMHFKMYEVEDLCFRLNINYENIPGDTINQKSRGLVKFMNRYHRIHELVNIVKKKRPALAYELSGLFY